MLKRLIDSKWTYYGLALLLLIAAVWSQIEVRVPSRPVGTVDDLAALRERDDVNVVFVLIDTLRADRLSVYGYERPTSPVLEDLASVGVRFAHVESQSSWTKCSMASLWTSLYPPRSGITRVEDAFPPEAELPAERLREAGFVTAGIWRNGWVGSNFGFNQGFDLYIRPHPSRSPDKMQEGRRNPGVGRLMGTDQDITESAIEFISTHAHERFFLYLHYMDVHQYVYDQVAADLGFGNSFSDAYDASIHWVDRNVGRVVYELERRGIFEKTLVVIASDHGEGFTEHGEGHARTLYTEVTQVPLVIALPFRLEAGVVVNDLVRNVDIWPTIFDLIGLDPPFAGDGRSLVPRIEAVGRGEPLRREPGAGDDHAIAYLDLTWGRKGQDPNPLVSVRRNAKRLLVRPEDDRVELYDHRTDPTEQDNLAEQGAAEVEALRRLAESGLDAQPPWGAVPQIELDDFYREQLRALGYVVK